MRIAIAGLGTVGAAAVRGLRECVDMIAARAGQKIEIGAVSARDKNKKRNCDLSGVDWVDDPRQLAALPGIDAVIELMGGAEGAARELAENTLKAGKHYITANKALIAAHGPELAQLAETHRVQLSFEAAVAGGVPIIKTLREALAGDEVSGVFGILNGTCNYILTQMQEHGASFDAALKEAQRSGYAEADPTADVGGGDTANKLAILAALAFGVVPDLAAIKTEGIASITTADLERARELGYRVKLLGVARQMPDGIEQWVGPALVPEHSPLAQTQGVLNAVVVRGNRVGNMLLQGAGAGGEATANAVIADIIDAARGIRLPAFGVPAVLLRNAKAVTAQTANKMVALPSAAGSRPMPVEDCDF